MTSDSGEARKKPDLAPETLAAQALGKIDQATRSLVPPLYASTTYERDPDGGYRSGRGYTRPHNPTYDEPRELLAELEGGADCLLFASGMAAANAVFQSLLPGDHVIASRVMYWALRTWLIDFALTWQLEVEFVETSDLRALHRAVRPGKTRLFWIETPANPTLEVTDIRAAAEIAHRAGAMLAVDSTAATPVLTRPIALGADIVMHSASKYLNGHSDVLAGALVCARQDALWQRIRAWHRDAGAVLGAFEAWLLLRGMRTLYLRVQRCSETALAFAQHFSGHPLIAAVAYPGLPGHPGHAIAASQMTGGFGGLISIRVAGGEANAVATAAHVRVFKRATSLGGVESLIEHRASIEGPSALVPRDALRLSIGIERCTDLIADLEQALAEAARLHPIPAAAERPRSGVEPSNEDDATTDALVVEIERLLAKDVRPIVAERGGEIALVQCSNGIVTLRIGGSPGAVLPIRAHIEGLLRHYVPGVSGVQLTTAGADPASSDIRNADAPSAEALARFIDLEIGPALASHGGALRLAELRNNVASVAFEGGCQGCAMANVTLRQGVEVMLKERFPDLVAIVDVTRHADGKAPYFKTKKGAT